MDTPHGLPPWPGPTEQLAIVYFLALTVAVPALGYFFMVADYRAYLRSLKRMLVRVSPSELGLPEWAKRETPRCLAAFGLRLPCTEEELKEAYRRKVKRLHPDRGGDQQRFMMLQRYFEESLRLVQECNEAE